MADCTYCGCDVHAHDPVFVSEQRDESAKAFCNYGCLAAHIDEQGLTAGTTCSLDAA